MDTNSFDIIRNIPLIIFSICFFIDFILFIWAGITLLRAKGNMSRVEKGRKLLSNALIVLFLILLIMLVFYLITYLLRQGKVFQPTPQTTGEFPPSFHIGSFPPAPEFITIGKYHFSGPWPLKGDQRITDIAITAVLCKKNGEYDKIYIGEASGDKLMRHKDYNCWLENCKKSNQNLYLAILRTSYEIYDPVRKQEIEEDLIKEFEPICSTIISNNEEP